MEDRTEELMATVREYLDALEFKYEYDEENKLVHYGVSGEDIPMDMFIHTAMDGTALVLVSPMPFTVPEEKRAEMAIAVSIANSHIVGSFDFDITDGKIMARISNCMADMPLTRGAFEMLLIISQKLTDDYNDKFMMLAKGMITLDQFAEYTQN